MTRSELESMDEDELRAACPQHPWTHSADLIREAVGMPGVLTRADASRLRDALARALDMPLAEMAERLSRQYMASRASVSP
jgi:hypothetical protein